MALNISIDASGAQTGARQFEQAVNSMGGAASNAASRVDEIMESFRRLQQVQQQNASSAFQELNVLKQQIQVQEQARAGALSLADAERKIGEAALFARTGNRELSQQLAAARQEFQRNAQAIREMEVASSRATQVFSLLRTGLGVAGIGFGIAAAVQGVKALVEEGIRYNATVEQQKIGLASIISATNNIADAQGKTLEGANAFAAAQILASDLMQQIQKDALETTATTEQLVAAFQTALGPLSAAGLSLNQAREATLRIVQAASALGIPMEQVSQEVRAIAEGSIDVNARLANALQITNAQVTTMREQGKLFDFIVEKTEDFARAGKATGESFNGLLSSIQDISGQLLGLALAGPFEALKGVLKDILASLQSIKQFTDVAFSAPTATVSIENSIALTKRSLEQYQQQLKEVQEQQNKGGVKGFFLADFDKTLIAQIEKAQKEIAKLEGQLTPFGTMLRQVGDAGKVAWEYVGDGAADAAKNVELVARSVNGFSTSAKNANDSGSKLGEIMRRLANDAAQAAANLNISAARITGNLDKFSELTKGQLSQNLAKEIVDAANQGVTDVSVIVEKYTTLFKNAELQVTEATIQEAQKRTQALLAQSDANTAKAQADAQARITAIQSALALNDAERQAIENIIGKEDERANKLREQASLQQQIHAASISRINAEIAGEQQKTRILQEQRATLETQRSSISAAPGDLVGQAQLKEVNDAIQAVNNSILQSQTRVRKLNAEIASEHAAGVAAQIEGAKRLRDEQEKTAAALERIRDLNQKVKEAETRLTQEKELTTRATLENDIRLEQERIDLLKARGGALGEVTARTQRLMQLERQAAQSALQSAENSLQIARNGVEIVAEQIRQQEASIAQGNVTQEQQERLLALQVERKNLLGKVEEAERARAKAAADAQSVELKNAKTQIDLQKEAAKNALISTGTIRDFFQDFARGIAEGNQNLGKLLTDFAQSISAKFFQQLLVGKQENFDEAIIGNVSELFGLGQGGILGSVMKSGGENLFSQLAQGFTGSGGISSLFTQGGTDAVKGDFSAGQEIFDASEVKWTQAGAQAGTSFLGGFGKLIGSGAIGFGIGDIIGGLFGVGQSKTGQLGGNIGGLVGGLAGSFLGPLGAGIGAALGKLLGGIIGDLFKPGRIQVEKEKIEKFFEDVFKGTNFKILKEPDVAAGLKGFDQLKSAALALGAVYAKTLGDKATEGSITRFGGQFLGNLEKMGTGSEESKKKIQELAQAMGADLGSAIEAINGLTTQFSKNQGNNLLSIAEFTENLEEARRNLAKYGETSGLTAKQLTELALANGNTGSTLVTYGDLITGAIQLNTEFKETALVTAGVNDLLADKFTEVGKAQGAVGAGFDELTDKIRSGNLSLEEAVIAFNQIQQAAGKAGLELKDFTLDPEKIKQFAELLKSLTFDADNFSKGLGDALSQGLANGLDPAKYGQTFDDFWNQLIRENIIKAIVAGFTQGLSLEALQPLFSGVTALLVEVGTGKLSLSDFGARLNDLLSGSQEQIAGIRDAFLAAGQAGKTLLDQFTGISGGQPDYTGFTSGLVSALQTGLNEGLDPSKYKDRFNEFFRSFLRTSITQAVVEGFAKGLALEALKPFFDKFSELLKGVMDNSLSVGDFGTQFNQLLQASAPALQQIQAALEQAGQAGYALLDALGLLPDQVEETISKVDELKNKLEEIAQKRIDIQINLQERLASIGVAGADQRALALRQQNLNDQIAKIKVDPIITGSIQPKNDAELTKAIAQIDKAIASIDTVSQGIVSNFNQQKGVIEANYQAQVDGIRKQGEATQTSIRASFDAQKNASQARIDALNTEKDRIQEAFQARQDAINAEIEALQKQLQIAQEFQRVGEQIRDSIIRLVGSNQAPIAPPGQLAFLQRQAESVRQQLATAPEAQQPDLINRLSDLLQQQLSLDVFQRPSTQYKEQFNAIVKELETLRDRSLASAGNVEDMQQRLVELQEEQNLLQKEQEVALRSIEAEIKAQQQLQKQLSEQEQAALRAAAEQTQASLDAARADADRQIEAARQDAARQLQDLAALQEELLAKQETLLQGRVSTEEQIASNTLRTALAVEKLAGISGQGFGGGTLNAGSVFLPRVSNGTVTQGPLGRDLTGDNSALLTNLPSAHNLNTGNVPAPGLSAFPAGWNPATQPGRKWDGSKWIEVQSGADVTWNAGTNQYYLHGQPITMSRVQELLANGLPTRAPQPVTSGLVYYPPGQRPGTPPSDVFIGTPPSSAPTSRALPEPFLPFGSGGTGSTGLTPSGGKSPSFTPFGQAGGTTISNAVSVKVDAVVNGGATKEQAQAFASTAGEAIKRIVDQHLASNAVTARIDRTATEVARREVNR